MNKTIPLLNLEKTEVNFSIPKLSELVVRWMNPNTPREHET
jgi:hypothetical protein